MFMYKETLASSELWNQRMTDNNTRGLVVWSGKRGGPSMGTAWRFRAPTPRLRDSGQLLSCSGLQLPHMYESLRPGRSDFMEIPRGSRCCRDILPPYPPECLDELGAGHLPVGLRFYSCPCVSATWLLDCLSQHVALPGPPTSCIRKSFYCISLS